MSEENSAPSDATRERNSKGLGFVVGIAVGALLAAPATWAVVTMTGRSEPAEEPPRAAAVSPEDLSAALEAQTEQLSQRIADVEIDQIANNEANELSLAQIKDQIGAQQSQIARLHSDLTVVGQMVQLDNMAQYREHIRAGAEHHLAGEYQESVDEFTKALALRPDALRAFLNRGMSHQELGNWEAALADFRAAQEIDPENYAPWNNIAWLLATCPDEEIRDGEQAVDAAKQACEKSEWKVFSAISTLAAAYAETGDFESAIAQNQRAMELAPEAARDELRQELARFQAAKPLRIGEEEARE